MKLKNFLKPSRLTWIIFDIIILFLGINAILLNTITKGIDEVLLIQIYLPLEFFESLGLKLSTSAGWFPLPNLFGYLLIIISNLAVIYIFSLLISKTISKFLKK